MKRLMKQLLIVGLALVLGMQFFATTAAAATKEYSEKEPNNSKQKATKLKLGYYVEGKFNEYADVDYYKIIIPRKGNFTLRVHDFFADGLDAVWDSNLPKHDAYSEANGYVWENLKPGTYYIWLEEKYKQHSEYKNAYALETKLSGEPSKPSVSTVYDTDTFVSGTANPESKITIKSGSKVIGSGNSYVSGKFKVSIPKTKAGTTLSITATDTQGISSSATTVKVKPKNDKTAPIITKVYPVDNHDTRVVGITEPGATVTINVGTNRIAITKAAKDGYFTAQIKPQSTNTTLYVYATDESGNKSKAYKVKVQKR